MPLYSPSNRDGDFDQQEFDKAMANAACSLDGEFKTYKEGSPSQRRITIHAFIEVSPLTSKGELMSYLKNNFPNVGSGGHRGMVNRIFESGEGPWDSHETRCPKCGASASSLAECLDIFGTRYKNTQWQSWCYACRKTDSRKRNAAKKAARAQAAVEQRVADAAKMVAKDAKKKKGAKRALKEKLQDIKSADKRDEAAAKAAKKGGK